LSIGVIFDHKISKKIFSSQSQQHPPASSPRADFLHATVQSKSMATGPRNPDGKTNSSGNAITHGCCCSVKVLVKGERQEDFDCLREGWLAAYEPDDQAAESLLEQAILNDWQLKRVQRQYHALQEKLAKSDPMDWTPGEEHKLQLMLRYKTAAERSFYRSVSAIERFRKVRFQESKPMKNNEPVEESEEPPELSRLDRALAALQQPLVKVPTEEQYIEILAGDDGKPTTDIYPSNEEILAISQTADPPLERIIRHIHFHGYLDGLPPEYEWLDDEIPGISNGRTQILTFDEWLAAVEREKQAGTGHLIPRKDRYEIHQKEKEE
jgi:hypothetical protein